MLRVAEAVGFAEDEKKRAFDKMLVLEDKLEAERTRANDVCHFLFGGGGGSGRVKKKVDAIKKFDSSNSNWTPGRSSLQRARKRYDGCAVRGTRHGMI